MSNNYAGTKKNKTENLDEITKQAKKMYDEYTFGDFCYNRDIFNAPLISTLARLDKNKIVFDVGCGTGYWLDKLVSFGFPIDNITGVDLSPSNVENLKKRGFNASCENILDLQLEDSISDFTICNGVIHHTTDPFKAFLELVRITKNDGRIYLMVYNKYNPYFYFVHRLTYPIRYLYWHYNKNIVDFIFQISKPALQIISRMVTGQTLDNKTARALFMDQIISPRAYLLSKSMLRSFAKTCNCQLQLLKYIKGYIEIAAIMKVNK